MEVHFNGKSTRKKRSQASQRLSILCRWQRKFCLSSNQIEPEMFAKLQWLVEEEGEDKTPSFFFFKIIFLNKISKIFEKIHLQFYTSLNNSRYSLDF